MVTDVKELCRIVSRKYTGFITQRYRQNVVHCLYSKRHISILIFVQWYVIYQTMKSLLNEKFKIGHGACADIEERGWVVGSHIKN